MKLSFNTILRALFGMGIPLVVGLWMTSFTTPPFAMLAAVFLARMIALAEEKYLALKREEEV